MALDCSPATAAAHAGFTPSVSGNAFPGVYPNGFSTQLTQRWRFGVTQTWPVTATVALVAQLERDIVSSNLPLYSYNNTSILFGPQIRF